MSSIFDNSGFIGRTADYSATDFYVNTNLTQSSLKYEWYTHTSGVHPTTTSELDAFFDTSTSGVSFGGTGSHTTSIKWGNGGQTSIIGVVGTKPAYLPADNFSWKVSGYILPDETGTYTFAIDGDDACDIAINGTVVAFWYGGHGFSSQSARPASATGTISLSAGQYYYFEARMEEGGLGDGIAVGWQKPSGSSIVEMPVTEFYEGTVSNGNKKNTGIWNLNTVWQNTELSPISVDYLIVAGGGGGGANGGGGGGAGGLLQGSFELIPSTNYSITVGLGGTGSSSGLVRGISGGNSSAFGLVALGGGGGASRDGGGAALSGGSGGGGGGGSSPRLFAGAGTSGQGNNGGNGSGNLSVDSTGGGGGGAGSAGTAGTYRNAGEGGNGLASSITGTSIYYAGGGGGGTTVNGSNGLGGLGGGGDGEVSAGTDGLGGGGGAGRNGGSGVVIVRTLKLASSTTGSPTITTDGDYNIYKFTQNGSITF